MDMSLSGFAILRVENQGWLVLRHLTSGSGSVRNLGDVAHWDIHLRILFPTYELSKKKARSTNLLDSLWLPQWGIFLFFQSPFPENGHDLVRFCHSTSREPRLVGFTSFNKWLQVREIWGDVAHWDIHLGILFPTDELSKMKARTQICKTHLYVQCG